MSAPSPPRTPRRIAGLAGRAVMVVLGVMIDVCGVLNVPGAVVLPASDAADATVQMTGFGSALTLLVVAAWLTLLWGRRFPLPVAIAGALLALVGTSYLLLLIGAVGVVRRRPERLRVVAITAGALVIGFVVREALTAWGGALPWFLRLSVPSGIDAEFWDVVSLLCALVSLGVAAAVVLLRRTRARAEHSEQRADAEVRRADALREETVRQAERERIARDMHDALAHRLSVVSLHAGALEAVAGEDQAGEMARTVREQTHAALQDMRGLIGELRSPVDSVSTAPATMRAVGPLVDGVRRGGVQVTSQILLESPERAGAQFDSAVYRIIQEALTNALKHAAGAPIDLYLHVAPSSGARIRVSTPLRPPVPGSVPGGANGILGIRERAEALGGRAWVGPHEGVFLVDVTLPWQERG